MPSTELCNAHANHKLILRPKYAVMNATAWRERVQLSIIKNTL